MSIHGFWRAVNVEQNSCIVIFFHRFFKEHIDLDEAIKNHYFRPGEGVKITTYSPST